MTNDQTAFEAILYDVSNHVATITLNRPERLNALNPAMRNELSDAVVMSGQRDDVRVIVITGAGRGFCSGGDVKAIVPPPPQRAKRGPAEADARMSDAQIAEYYDVVTAGGGATARRRLAQNGRE